MISNITTQCWILALFVRDDGERLLLGDGAYDFKSSQQHFKANLIVNDAVDVQGNDGTLLAGQVRRATTQNFDGYVGDATSTPQEIEQYRRDFFAFFLKNHFYEVIYIFQDGTAIKRQKGFLVDAPEIKELFQISPEYHVALNFEDVNYYEYQEDADGNEIYSDSANIPLSTMAQGGLLWDEDGVVWEYSQKNLLIPTPVANGNQGIAASVNNYGIISLSGTGVSSWSNAFKDQTINLPSGDYVFSIDEEMSTLQINLRVFYTDNTSLDAYIAPGNTSVQVSATKTIAKLRLWMSGTSGTNTNGISFRAQFESGSTATDCENPFGGAVWEEGGGGGISNVQVDSIDIVYPVLTIQGPAQNPVVENLTTNTRIEFNGNVTNSQTLVIDSRNQTAKLNGTSVITRISGAWPIFAPGINRVSYTAENDSAPDALIEWSEVVG